MNALERVQALQTSNKLKMGKTGRRLETYVRYVKSGKDWFAVQSIMEDDLSIVTLRNWCTDLDIPYKNLHVGTKSLLISEILHSLFKEE